MGSVISANAAFELPDLFLTPFLGVPCSPGATFQEGMWTEAGVGEVENFCPMGGYIFSLLDNLIWTGSNPCTQESFNLATSECLYPSSQSYE